VNARRSMVMMTGISWLAGVASGSGALADEADPAKAEELIRQANEQRRQGHDERAVPLVRQAYEIARSARTAGQLGLAEMALGYWATAAGHLGEALAEERNPWVEKNGAVLERALRIAESHLAEIRVEGRPEGAEVIVNGSIAGTLPLARPLKVNEGRVTVEVRARGRRPITTTLTLAGRASERVTVSLESESSATPPPNARVAPPQPPPLTNVDTGPVASGAGDGAPAVNDESPTTTGELRWRRVLAWSLLGGALAAGSIGVWQHLSAQSAQRSFDAITACGTDAAMRGIDGRCRVLYSDFQARRTRAYIGYGLAAAFGAGAVTLLVLNATNGSDATAPDGNHVSMAFGPGGATLSYAARF
jgi:hypothetical protein